MRRVLIAATLLLCILRAPLHAVDLAKIDRTIAKEPTYKTKTPKYCLAVFGPEAKTRVWLVLDGDTLYVDRNGNGDLTEKEERMAVKAERNWHDGDMTFEAGELRDGELLHKNVRVDVRRWSELSAATTDQDVAQLLADDPEAQLFSINLDLEMPRWKGAAPGERVTWTMGGTDHLGLLKLGKTPTQAPIVHFGGPWHVVLREKHELVIEREAWLVAHVGTPGLGAGATACIAYEKIIPEAAHPVVEISYPPARADDPPVRQRYELKDRC